MTISKKDLLSKFKKIHGNKYDYSKVVYTGNEERITIICPKHNEFEQNLKAHLNGAGCKKCAMEFFR